MEAEEGADELPSGDSVTDDGAAPASGLPTGFPADGHDTEGEGEELYAEAAYDSEEDAGEDSDTISDDAEDGEEGERSADESETQDDVQEETDTQPSERERVLSTARREAQALLDAERARHKQEMDAFVKSLGIRDADGNAIESREALDTYNSTQRTDEARARLRRAGIDVEALEELVSGNPEVKAARAAVAEAEREKARSLEERQRAAFDEEIRAVGEIDPTVKSADDLRAKPYFDEVYRMVGRGSSISDAVRLATYDERMRRVAEGSARSAAQKAASKAHLVPTSSRGQGAQTVPAAVRNQYRLFYPDATDGEIQKMFNDDQKRMKK